MKFVFLLVALIIFVRFYDIESAPASKGRKGVEHKMRRAPRWYPKPENISTIEASILTGNETQGLMENNVTQVETSSNSQPDNMTGTAVTTDTLQTDLPAPIGNVQDPPTNTTLKGFSTKSSFEDQKTMAMILGFCFVCIFLLCYTYAMARSSALKRKEREEGAIYFDAPRPSRFNIGLQQVRNYMAKK